MQEFEEFKEDALAVRSQEPESRSPEDRRDPQGSGFDACLKPDDISPITCRTGKDWRGAALERASTAGCILQLSRARPENMKAGGSRELLSATLLFLEFLVLLFLIPPCPNLTHHDLMNAERLSRSPHWRPER